MTKIKICGIFRECDIEYVNEAKPDYAGFILFFPRSHRNVEMEEALKLRERLDRGIKAAGVFVDQPVETVVQAASKLSLDVIQLHGHETDEYIEEIRDKTGLPVWKAFQVRTAGDLREAAGSKADEILLDGGYGTGTAFDWTAAEGFSRPFILAGGLTPELIPQAAARLRPKIVDISSGVETDRVKDRDKILAAVRASHGTGTGPGCKPGRGDF